ncbi:Imm21 family immunity protein [Kitasatospora sp. NPDC058201]|uniref:Imm21 family immunity protein n=1 Tax=unclassified Kitasatospora TaxID=2633591 RepID=UPI00364BF1CB
MRSSADEDVFPPGATHSATSAPESTEQRTGLARQHRLRTVRPHPGRGPARLDRYTEADDVIGEYVATIRRTSRDVLTLGGEPLPITWIPEARVFARWYYAEDDSTLLSALEAALDSDDWEDVLDIELGGRYVLTDAAYSGTRIADHTGSPTEIPELIRVELPSGRYRVQSLIIDPDPETQWMLERLLPE